MAQSEPVAPAKPARIEDRITAAIAPDPDPAPAPAPPTEVAPDETVRQTPEPEGDRPAAPAEAEAGTTARQPQDGGKSADEGEGERQESASVEIGTFSDLASHLGVEVEDLYHITVPIDVEGKRAEFEIGEWKDKVRAGVEADALAEQRKAFAEERQAVEGEIAARRQQAQQSIAEAAALTESAEKRLLSDLEGVDWAELRSSDPAEWAAKSQEVKDRQAQIQEAKQELAKSWQAQTETMRAEQVEKLGEHLARERDALLQAVPEWRDEGAFDTERKVMREYLSGVGFADNEIDNATDHRLIVMARKARLYDEQQAQTSVARKKVAKVGKIVRPGSASVKQAGKQDTLTKLQGTLRKSGKVEDAAAIIRERMNRN